MEVMDNILGYLKKENVNITKYEIFLDKGSQTPKVTYTYKFRLKRD